MQVYLRSMGLEHLQEGHAKFSPIRFSAAYTTSIDSSGSDGHRQSLWTPVKLRLKPSSEERGWWFEAQLHWE